MIRASEFMNGKVPVIGIVRGVAADRLDGLVGAVRRGGLQFLEITMNSPGAAKQIAEAVRLAEGSELRIGAGTVTDGARLEEALGAGASFIVTPSLNREVARECARRKIPIFPGAFSPSEILEAWELGAAMVKIFPAEVGGAGFIKALRGPFPDIRLLPTGGVGLDSLPALIEAGAAGAGVGSPLFQRDRIAAGDWEWLEEQTRRYVQGWRGAKRSG